MANNPLVSVIVIAYKQERFVRDAVRSVLAQTYEPLQIVISDDCSPDRTFEIMKEEKAAYVGPHEIVLNRNEPNRGLAGNFNRACELARGDLIVVHAGDDVSLPERVRVLAQAWREPTPVDFVCSNVSMIGDDGAALDKQWEHAIVSDTTLDAAIARGAVGTLGCAAGFSRRLWTKYGPLDSAVLQEDGVIPFRALLERGVRTVDRPLVKYRLHGDNMFSGTLNGQKLHMAQRRRWAANLAAVTGEWIRAWDLDGRPNDMRRRRLARLYRQRTCDAVCYECSRMSAALIAAGGLSKGLSFRNVGGLLWRHVLRR